RAVEKSYERRIARVKRTVKTTVKNHQEKYRAFRRSVLPSGPAARCRSRSPRAVAHPKKISARELDDEDDVHVVDGRRPSSSRWDALHGANRAAGADAAHHPDVDAAAGPDAAGAAHAIDVTAPDQGFLRRHQRRP